MELLALHPPSPYPPDHQHFCPLIVRSTDSSNSSATLGLVQEGIKEREGDAKNSFCGSLIRENLWKLHFIWHAWHPLVRFTNLGIRRMKIKLAYKQADFIASECEANNCFYYDIYFTVLCHKNSHCTVLLAAWPYIRGAYCFVAGNELVVCSLKSITLYSTERFIHSVARFWR